MVALTRAFPYDAPADHCCYKVIFFDRIVNEKLFRDAKAPEDRLRLRKFVIQDNCLLDAFVGRVRLRCAPDEASQELSES